MRSSPSPPHESEDPRRAVTKATNSVIWRIGVFYLGSIFIVLTLLPWNDKSIVDKGSYVAALDSIGIAHAGQIMNVIVLTAVLSCLNSGLYTASRMAFSLGERGDAPKAFAKVSKNGVPTAAILGSVVFGFLAVYFNYAFPDTIFDFLLNSSGAIALFVWLVICLTQLRMRRILEREAPEKLTVKMWLFPGLTWITARHDRLRPGLHGLRQGQPRDRDAVAAGRGGRPGDRRGPRLAPQGRRGRHVRVVPGYSPRNSPGPRSWSGAASFRVRAAQRRSSSFHVAGSRPIARAALTASPIRNGVRPPATAAAKVIPVDRARYGTPTA